MVRAHFRPEFLNRLDDIIIFRSLSREDLTRIIHLELRGVETRVAKKGFKLTLTPQAMEHLIDQGYNPDYGARPLRRSIERLIEDPLSESILRGEFKDSREIVIRLRDKHLLFDAVQPEGKDKKEVAAEEKK